MSLVPVFEIGLWNAWIFMSYPLLVTIFIIKIKRGKDPGKVEIDALSKNGRRIFNFSFIILFTAILYSVFLPLKLDTIWFYTGLPIAIIGFVSFTIVIVSFTATPWDKPVTKGLYRYSMHPMYITTAISLLGVGIASASWFFLLLSVAFIVLSIFRAANEERFCLEKYGEEYRDYMNKTPRWIGIPKS